jgi:hypothetical protein
MIAYMLSSVQDLGVMAGITSWSRFRALDLNRLREAEVINTADTGSLDYQPCLPAYD